MAARVFKVSILLAVCCHWLVAVPGEGARKGWTNKEADVYFMIDSAASIWIGDYRKMLKFVANLVSEMDIGPTRVGVGVYAKDHHLYLPINNTFNQNQLQDKITTAPHLKGIAYISRALKGMMGHLLSPNVFRPGVPLITILLTDGTSRHRQLAHNNATLAKSEGIFIFTVGIGYEVDQNELRAIASDPKPRYTYHVSDFEYLKDILPQLSLRMSEVEVLQSDEGTCSNSSNVDVVFVFDESALGERDTQKVKDFIASLVKDFSMNSGKVRVGLVSSTCKEGDTILGQYVKKEEFIDGLKAKDGPDISVLVKRAFLESFLPENGARFDAKYRMVLILHSDVKRRFETLRQISKAKYSGIGVFVVQLGTSYDQRFVSSLASDETNIMYSESADHLASITPEEKLKFMSGFC